jgi:hypothetical protein
MARIRLRTGSQVTALALLVGLGALLRAPVQAAPGGAPGLGLVHVDVMDLHVERTAGGVQARELLPPADLAERFRMAAASGVQWNRWSLYWDLVQQGGAWDWSVADGMVARDVAAGLATLAILQGTPGEYATSGQVGAPVPGVGSGWRSGAASLWPPWALAPQASPPRGLDAPIFRASGGLTDDPAAAVAVNPGNPWAVFVDAVVRRYRPGGDLARARGWAADAGVRAWEVGNEPNLPFFWSGTPGQFVRYLEVAYLVIKRADPAATVLHGGIADDAGAADWFNRFLDGLKARAAGSPLPARHGWYFDKTAWHWYTYPALLQTGPEKVRSLLTAKGLPVRPIWVTEMGVPVWNEYPGPCWDPVSPWRATGAEQAGYVWQAVSEGLAAGVENMILFQLYDDCGNGPASYDAFGLVRNQASNQCWVPPAGQVCWRFDPAQAGTPRPAYGALQVAARELRGTELLWRPPREADGWQRVLFYQPPDRRVMVLWNHYRTTKVVEVYATGTEATFLELADDGSVRQSTVRPAGGRLRPTLPGATNRNNPGNQSPVMAGRPVIVVEKDVYAPFRSELKPLPAESGPNVDLTVAAADGGTGVGAVTIWFATRPPVSAADWQPLVTERLWAAAPLAGEMTVRVTFTPGPYWLAVRTRDRAGNWTALPATAQASTVVKGTAPAATPTGAPTSRPATATPRPPLAHRVWLPFVVFDPLTGPGPGYPGPGSH